MIPPTFFHQIQTACHFTERNVEWQAPIRRGGSAPTGGVLFICVRAATLLSDIEQRSSYVLVQQHGQYGDQRALYYV